MRPSGAGFSFDFTPSLIGLDRLLRMPAGSLSSISHLFENRRHIGKITASGRYVSRPETASQTEGFTFRIPMPYSSPAREKVKYLPSRAAASMTSITCDLLAVTFFYPALRARHAPPPLRRSGAPSASAGTSCDPVLVTPLHTTSLWFVFRMDIVFFTEQQTGQECPTGTDIVITHEQTAI